MEVGRSMLDVIDENVDMMDVEEGEVVVGGQVSGKIVEGEMKELEVHLQNVNIQTANDVNKMKKKKKKKRKNKKAKGVPGPTGFDLDRFVIGVCKRLREKKSYLVYTGVGVLGADAFSDLVKEVDAIQACGGQKTAEGNRYRNGGGILWNILKKRDPNAYREIMKKGKEFEKQFRRPITVSPTLNKITSQDAGPASVNTIANNPDGGPEMKTSGEGQLETPTGKRRSVHDRIRVPVTYDDLPGDEPQKDEFS